MKKSPGVILTASTPVICTRMSHGLCCSVRSEVVASLFSSNIHSSHDLLPYSCHFSFSFSGSSSLRAPPPNLHHSGVPPDQRPAPTTSSRGISGIGRRQHRPAADPVCPARRRNHCPPLQHCRRHLYKLAAERSPTRGDILRLGALSPPGVLR